MELGTTYIILSYIGPICGIVGFIITPGLTVIRPWLIEKFSKEKRKIVENTLQKDFKSMHNYSKLLNELYEFDLYHRFDWRPKISKKRHELKRQIKNVR